MVRWASVTTIRQASRVKSCFPWDSIGPQRMALHGPHPYPPIHRLRRRNRSAIHSVEETAFHAYDPFNWRERALSLCRRLALKKRSIGY